MPSKAMLSVTVFSVRIPYLPFSMNRAKYASAYAQTAANSTADTSFAKAEVLLTYVSDSSSTGCGGTMVEIACL